MGVKFCKKYSTDYHIIVKIYMYEQKITYSEVFMRNIKIFDSTLRDGEQALDGGMGLRGTVQDGQHHGYGDAVVAAQGGVGGRDPAVGIYLQLQAVGGEIVGGVGGLLAYHVGVSLEENGGNLLQSLGGRLFDQHVVHRVAVAPKSALTRERL